MRLNDLPKLKQVDKKRVGRGLGSGKGKTGGKGTKGQKARGKLRLGFIGGSLPLYRKLPLVRGKGNPRLGQKAIIISLTMLSSLKPGTVVDMDTLVQNGIISRKDIKDSVKILGNGEIKSSLTVKLPVSGLARKKIEAAKGKVVNE
ncbi:MAG: 50S ribosomal protein L15 [Candidatus Daviesbacteria bacterium]|nr:50S ribosomal protein L15 [Candidatus Daviesbacteria bacterium]